MDEVVKIRGTCYVVCECINCGTVFLVAQTVINHQRTHSGFHYCPAGHQQGWPKGGAEIDRLRRERDRLAQQIAARDDEIAAERRKRAKVEKEIARQKKRAAAGVCSCCNRTFQNLARHMASKHPDLAA